MRRAAAPKGRMMGAPLLIAACLCLGALAAEGARMPAGSLGKHTGAATESGAAGGGAAVSVAGRSLKKRLLKWTKVPKPSPSPPPPSPAPPKPPPSPPPPRPPPAGRDTGMSSTVAVPTYTASNQADIKAFLSIQNAARTAVGSTSLVWNETLAVSAFQWLMKLYNEQSCKLVHPWDAPYKNSLYANGQNLAGFSGDPSLIKFGNANATQLWVNEKAFFSYNVFPTTCTNSNASLCGHYTQVVWNQSTSVGCSNITCPAAVTGVTPAAGATIWACEYSPRGNAIGQTPYDLICGAGKYQSGLACVDGVEASWSKGLYGPDRCKSVVCPKNTACKLFPGFIPVCSCPTGSFYDVKQGSCFSSEASIGASSMSMALYSQDSYNGVPTVLRIPNDDRGTGMGTCVALPSGLKPKSYQLVLNPDGTTKAKPPCTYPVFFPDSGCQDVVTDNSNPTQATGAAYIGKTVALMCDV